MKNILATLFCVLVLTSSIFAQSKSNYQYIDKGDYQWEVITYMKNSTYYVQILVINKIDVPPTDNWPILTYDKMPDYMVPRFLEGYGSGNNVYAKLLFEIPRAQISWKPVIIVDNAQRNKVIKVGRNTLEPID